MLGTDHPGDEEAVCLAGRGAWDTFAGLCSPAAVRTKVPYGTTHLPVWFFRPDGPAEPRPTVILTNGSDGQNFDVFHPGRPQQMDDLLRTRRAYVNMTEATGAQLHCSPMAPQQHCDVVFDWLADVLQR
ncbi:hypothetical protein DEJ51_32790 [Streptomyces venezuelae]|uniref:Esterase n=1 Tax=Streptomyces venezuelae TaxID=54571 RepID=A0A5P2E0B3_STRVZ|nr:hypothetical protein [Streptomyces venezuelae]QES58329.1 hypothetical protein DEJ51_32790 [Streptomyces venezuelae]